MPEIKVLVNIPKLLKGNAIKKNSISIEVINSNTFKVTISAIKKTEHFVTVTQAFLNQFSKYNKNPESIVIHSFEFLLDREPNTSILKNFDIQDISKFFPEYIDNIKKYF